MRVRSICHLIRRTAGTQTRGRPPHRWRSDYSRHATRGTKLCMPGGAVRNTVPRRTAASVRRRRENSRCHASRMTRPQPAPGDGALNDTAQRRNAGADISYPAHGSEKDPTEVAAAVWVSVAEVDRRLRSGVMAVPWAARLDARWAPTLRAIDTIDDRLTSVSTMPARRRARVPSSGRRTRRWRCDRFAPGHRKHGLLRPSGSSSS